MISLESNQKSYNLLSDEKLAEYCLEHNHLAFQELMNRYLKQIFNFIRQYTQTSEETEDATQETFFKIWKNIKKYQKDKRFKPWMYAIARNTALDYLKKKKNLSFSELDNEEDTFSETLEDTTLLPSEVFDNLLLKEKISKILEFIHPDYRTVIILHYDEKMTFEEISIIMNKPMNTVKSWHHRAILQMQKQLKDTLHQ